MKSGHPLFRPVIFGLSDGAMSIIGVVLYAAGHAGAVFNLALSGGLSAALSMGGSEWLSDSENGFTASLTMAASTLFGSVLPAVPYLLLTGWAAPLVSLVMLGGVALAVGRMREHRKHPNLESFSILTVVLIVSIVCGIFL